MTTPPVTLEESYEHCRALAKRHGTTYYWSTLLLPRIKRHHVWALYAFCRAADDIIDEPDDALPTDDVLAVFGEAFLDAVAAGGSDDILLKAVVHTVRAFDIDPNCFRRFLTSMEMDLAITGYDTWDDLLGYMDGSAAVIGEMMLPILEPRSDGAVAPARDLGLAFQMTNLLRDVGEDLDRGRVYLPREDLERFGADPRSRRVDESWRRLMRLEIERCRRLYASADSGIALLPPSSARCVRAARILYAEILDQIEDAGYDVFTMRARVPAWRKALVAARVARYRR